MLASWVAGTLEVEHLWEQAVQLDMRLVLERLDLEVA